MPNIDVQEEFIYAGPWVELTSQNFIRYRVQQDRNDHPMMMGRVIGKVKKGVASWTWFIYGTTRHIAKSTGSCSNKRDAIRACDEALRLERVLLLKPKHYSFL